MGVYLSLTAVSMPTLARILADPRLVRYLKDYDDVVRGFADEAEATRLQLGRGLDADDFHASPLSDMIVPPPAWIANQLEDHDTLWLDGVAFKVCIVLTADDRQHPLYQAFLPREELTTPAHVEYYWIPAAEVDAIAQALVPIGAAQFAELFAENWDDPRTSREAQQDLTDAQATYAMIRGFYLTAASANKAVIVDRG